VLSRYSAASLFESRYFTVFTVLCLVPALIGAATIYFVHSATTQLLLGMRLSSTDLINNVWFWGFLQSQVWLAFVMTVWGVPGMMTRDLANHALQLYLSRPLSRPEYLLGKVSAVVLLLSAITWIPGLLLFGLQAQLEGHGWGSEHLWLPALGYGDRPDGHGAFSVGQMANCGERSYVCGLFCFAWSG
jgi:ABC-2 type transport system permease protein